jgi:formate C-acetyltransferase
LLDIPARFWAWQKPPLNNDTTQGETMASTAPQELTHKKVIPQWEGFNEGFWQSEINVRDFIQQNYEPYEGDESFLAPATARTKKIWDRLNRLFVEERKKGVLDISQIPSSITAHAAGYIDRENEIIVGLQTEAPLKRAIMPNGGFRMVLNALKTYGHEPDPNVVEAFTKYRKTHNEGVFDAYTSDVRKCRSSHILTGLPDAYGRGRIIGDYRRVALYGVTRLIKQKEVEKQSLDALMSSDEIIRDREELSEQIRALNELQQMASSYGFDISTPARTAREAVQWLYFGYLAAVKEQNGAAMSLGRTSTFLDIYFQRDLNSGELTEEQAQEIVDDFVIKLRIVRFLRTPEYDDLFAGDPTWVTESIGGMGDDGRPLVTKTSFRFLQTLYNLGPAPEPNLTIWYSPWRKASEVLPPKWLSIPALFNSKAMRSCVARGEMTVLSRVVYRQCYSANKCSFLEHEQISRSVFCMRSMVAEMKSPANKWRRIMELFKVITLASMKSWRSLKR